MTKISTLRSRGFRLVKLTGNATMISHDKPFTVDGKASVLHSDHRKMISGHHYKDIPYDVKLS
jgi:hypothetical protein